MGMRIVIENRDIRQSSRHKAFYGTSFTRHAQVAQQRSFHSQGATQMGLNIQLAELRCTECGNQLQRVVTTQGGQLPTVIKGVCGARETNATAGCGETAKLSVKNWREP